MAEGDKIGKYAVVAVDYGETCSRFGRILCVEDTFEKAAEEMLSAYRDMEAENEGYFTAKYTSKTAEIWYDESRSAGYTWSIVEV